MAEINWIEIKAKKCGEYLEAAEEFDATGRHETAANFRRMAATYGAALEDADAPETSTPATPNDSDEGYSLFKWALIAAVLALTLLVLILWLGLPQ